MKLSLCFDESSSKMETNVTATNGTLLENIFAVDFQEPSTSTFVSVSPHSRDLLIGELPEIDPNNITGMATTTNATTESTGLEGFFRTVESMFNESAWIVYTVIAIVTLLIICIICFIFMWIVKNKKRIVQQDDDPVLANGYNGGNSWTTCCLCCQAPNKQSQLQARQNSASNLDPYKRPPLPPIGAKNGPYISTFNSTEALDNLARPPTVDENSLAININSIRGVPHVHLQPEQYRNLPPLKMHK
ncbi:unnamed protein product [Cylicocyclus nassatus]|uniref:Uncharacterized protein n=1 Tax=Cylicocyclus nassatus TaxID=53992 RepID=A0AA36GIG3_CYLNA|nr:unnamed protein product [Cylicocyclus nassatus]